MSHTDQFFVLAIFLGLLVACGGGTTPLYTNDSGGAFDTSSTPTFQIPAGFGNPGGRAAAPGERSGGVNSTPAPASMNPALVDGGAPTSNPVSNPDSNRSSDERLAESVLEVIDVLSGVGSSGAELGRVGDAIFSTGLRWRIALPVSMAGDTKIDLENTGLLHGLSVILMRLQQTPQPIAASLRALGAGHGGGQFPSTGMLSYSCGKDATDSILRTGNPAASEDPGRYEVQSLQVPEGAGFFLGGKVLTVQFYNCLLDGHRLNGGFNLSTFTVYEPPAQDGVYRKEIRAELSFNGLNVRRGLGEAELSTENGSRTLLQVTYAGDGRVLSIRLDSGHLTLSRAGNQNERLRNLILQREAYLNGGGWTLEVSGALISSITETRIEVETPEPLRWLPEADRPFSGILTIRQGSTPLRITFLDAPLLERVGDEQDPFQF